MWFWFCIGVISLNLQKTYCIVIYRYSEMKWSILWYKIVSISRSCTHGNDHLHLCRSSCLCLPSSPRGRRKISKLCSNSLDTNQSTGREEMRDKVGTRTLSLSVLAARPKKSPVVTLPEEDFTLWFFSPIKSVGFFSMKFSQSLMNMVVVSLEGHSPWLKKKGDIVVSKGSNHE